MAREHGNTTSISSDITCEYFYCYILTFVFIEVDYESQQEQIQ